MNINNSNINYKSEKNINNLKILILGFLLSLFFASITFYFSTIQHNEIFNLLMQESLDIICSYFLL